MRSFKSYPPSTKIYSSRTNGRKFFESRRYVQAVCHVAFRPATYSETCLQCRLTLYLRANAFVQVPPINQKPTCTCNLKKTPLLRRHTNAQNRMDKQNTKIYKGGCVDVHLLQAKLLEEGIKLVTRKTELNDGSRKNCLTAFRSQFKMV